ncbi:hypothetical protein GCM10027185_35320 [Spirosoma pulveris]
MTEHYARIIFLNASALHTNLILLSSTSVRFPNGLDNDNGLLGTHMAFHSYRGRISATYEGLDEFMTNGRRPNSSYIIFPDSETFINRKPIFCVAIPLRSIPQEN